MVVDSNLSMLAQTGLERDEFRTAMARIATAVHVITTAGPSGRRRLYGLRGLQRDRHSANSSGLSQPIGVGL